MRPSDKGLPQSVEKAICVEKTGRISPAERLCGAQASERCGPGDLSATLRNRVAKLLLRCPPASSTGLARFCGGDGRRRCGENGPFPQ